MKIAVVGCGITGAYLGWKLAEKGNSVTIFEKRNKIGKEVCSGLISERLWNFIPKNEKLIKNKVNYCRVNFPNKTVTLKFKIPFVVLSHAEMDNYVADLAKKSGANISLNAEIKEIPKEFDKVIGTGGALDTIRKNLKLKEPKNYLGLLCYVNEKDHSDVVDAWPIGDGFCWRIPRGENIEYGIMANPKLARMQFDKFAQQQNFKIENLKAALIPQGLIIPKNKDVTICGGDATGLTKPWSGGGVIWTLTSANILLNAFPNFNSYCVS
ncbi:MAG: NAD(P)-binding protein [DPANN group archaeon]|nr:NAD(P)-binding protein [DPANN group archaeon]